MIEAQLPDGTILEFEEGTDTAVIQSVVKRQMGIESAPAQSERELVVPEQIAPESMIPLDDPVPEPPRIEIPDQKIADAPTVPSPVPTVPSPVPAEPEQPGLYDRLAGALYESTGKPLQRGWNRAEQALDIATGDIEGIAENTRDLAALGQSEDLYQLQRELGPHAGLLETVAGFATSPGALWDLTMESLAPSLGSIAASTVGRLGGGLITGSPIGAAVGGAAGGGLAEGATEYYLVIAEEMQESGYDMTDPRSIRLAFSDNGFMERAEDRALKRGIGVGMFGMFSAGIAGKVADPVARVTSKVDDAADASNLGKIAGGSSEIAVQAASGAAGEAAAQAFSGDELDTFSIVAEAFGEVLPGAVESGIGYASNKVDWEEKQFKVSDLFPQSDAEPDTGVVTPDVNGDNGLSGPPPPMGSAPFQSEGQNEPPVSPSGEQAVQPISGVPATVSGSDRSKVSTAKGREVDTQWRIVEASSLTTSDQEEYDPALQPRDRGNRAASTAQINDIQNNLDPARLGESPEADRGAPIVGPDGMVESGNGRVAAIRGAYEAGGADGYRAWLSETTEQEVDDFDQPVLVRVRDTEMTPEDRQAFAIEANESATGSFSATEQANADAARIDTATLSLLQPEDINGVNNREFIGRFLQKMNPAERAEFMQDDGTLSAPGVNRIQAAVLAVAYGDKDNRTSNATLSRMLESTDNNVKSITGAMLDVAPQFAQIREDAAAGRVEAEWDISAKLVEAVETVSQIRSNGRSVQEFIDQDGLFGENDPIVEELIRAFYNDDLSRAAGRKAIADALKFYAEAAIASGQAIDMFNETGDPKGVLSEGRQRAQGQEVQEKPKAEDNTGGAESPAPDAGVNGEVSPTEQRPSDGEEGGGPVAATGQQLPVGGTPGAGTGSSTEGRAETETEAVEQSELPPDLPVKKVLDRLVKEAIEDREQTDGKTASSSVVNYRDSEIQAESSVTDKGAKRTRFLLDGKPISRKKLEEHLDGAAEQGTNAGDTGRTPPKSEEGGKSQGQAGAGETKPADNGAGDTASETQAPTTGDELVAIIEADESIANLTYQRDNMLEAANAAESQKEINEVYEKYKAISDREKSRDVKGAINKGIPYTGPFHTPYPVDKDGKPESSGTADPYTVELFKDNHITINYRAKKNAGPMITREKALKKHYKWKEHAKAQNKLRSLDGKANYERVVVSLFDKSGKWAQPYLDAGYEIITVDLQDGIDISDLSPSFFFDHLYHLGNVYAVLAAPPCTVFTQSNSRTRTPEQKATGKNGWQLADEDGRTHASQEMVAETLKLIEFLKPSVWAIENPEHSRIGRTIGGNDDNNATGLGRPKINFLHESFGDPGLKPTSVWGNFNPMLPTAQIPKSDKSMTNKVGGKSLEAMNVRSETPEGFAYAFFMANNFIDNQKGDYALDQLRITYPYLIDPIEEAYASGVPIENIYKAAEETHDWGDFNEVAFNDELSFLGDDRVERQSNKDQDTGEPPKLVLSRLHNKEWSEATGLEPEQIEKFAELGDLQRGKPEVQMVKTQNELGGGVMNFVVEHLGDLSNRMSPRHSLGFAQEESVDKIDKVLRTLESGYGFEKEFLENLSNSGVTKADAMTSLGKYADAHAELPAYNMAQRFARDAAVEVGRGNYQKGAVLLHRLRGLIDTPENFKKSLGSFDKPESNKDQDTGETPTIDALAPGGKQAREKRSKKSKRVAQFKDRDSDLPIVPSLQIYVDAGLNPDTIKAQPIKAQWRIASEQMVKKFGFGKVTKQPQLSFLEAVEQLQDIYASGQLMVDTLGMHPNLLSLDGNVVSLYLFKVYIEGDGSKHPGTLAYHLINDSRNIAPVALQSGVPIPPGKQELAVSRRNSSFAHEWMHGVDARLLHDHAPQLLGSPTKVKPSGEEVEIGRLLSGKIRLVGTDNATTMSDTVKNAFVDVLNALFFDDAALALYVMDLERKIANARDTSSANYKNNVRKLDAIKKGMSKALKPRSIMYKSARDAEGRPDDDLGAYYQMPTEMFARAGEAYIAYKFMNLAVNPRGMAENDTHYRSSRVEETLNVYPDAKDRQRIYDAYDKLFLALSQEETLGPRAQVGPQQDIVHWSKDHGFDSLSKEEQRALNAARRESEKTKINEEKARKKAKKLRDRIARNAGKKPNKARVALQVADEFYNRGLYISALTTSIRSKLIYLERKYPASQGIKDIRRLFASKPGSDEQGLPTYELELQTYLRRFGGLMDDMVQAAEGSLSDNVGRDLYTLMTTNDIDKLPAKIRTLDSSADKGRKILDALHNLAMSHGNDLGYVESYLPRRLNKDYLDNTPGAWEEFNKVAVIEYRDVFERDITTLPGVENDPNEAEKIYELASLWFQNSVIYPDENALLGDLKDAREAYEAVKGEEVDSTEERQAFLDAAAELFPAVHQMWAEKSAIDYENAARNPDVTWSDQGGVQFGDSQWSTARNLTDKWDERAKEFLINDAFELISTYTSQVVRRTMIAKYLGRPDSKKRDRQVVAADYGLPNNTYGWVNNGGPGWKLSAALTEMTSKGVSPADVDEVQRDVAVMLGVFDSQRTKAETAGTAAVQAGMTGYILMHSVWSALHEPSMAGVRSGGKRGMKMSLTMQGSVLKRAFIDIGAQIDKQLAKRTDLSLPDIAPKNWRDDIEWSRTVGRMLGLYNSTTGSEVMAQKYNLPTFNVKAAKVMQIVFRWNGNHWHMNSAIQSLVPEFFDELNEMAVMAMDGDKEAVRYLREMGVVDSLMIQKMSELGPRPTPEAIENFEYFHPLMMAAAKSAQERIMQPNKVDKQTHASLDHGYRHLLTSFLSAFQDLVVQPFRRRMMNPDISVGHKAGMVGTATVAMMFALSFWMLRQQLFGKDGWDEDEYWDRFDPTDPKFWMTWIDKMGFFGRLSPIINIASSGIRYAGTTKDLMTGPYFGSILEDVDTIIDLFGRENSPNTHTKERAALVSAIDLLGPLGLYLAAHTPVAPYAPAAIAVAGSSANKRAFAELLFPKTPDELKRDDYKRRKKKQEAEKERTGIDPGLEPVSSEYSTSSEDGRTKRKPRSKRKERSNGR